MQKIVNFWNFVDGHKTNVGSLLVTLYTFAVQLNIVTYNQDVLTVLGILFGIGVTHKTVKYINKTA